MHKIEHLLQTLAPKGVEFRKLGDMTTSFTKQTGFDYSAFIKPTLIKEYLPNYIPFIQNKDFLGHYINYKTDYFIPNEIASRFPQILLNEKCLLISISGSIGKVAVFNHSQDAFIGGAIAVLKFKEKKSLDFVMHFLMSASGQKLLLNSVKSSSHKNLTIADLRNLTIPIPPLEIQQEIVKILDAFTELNTELNTELKARKKQYAYYQNMLLDFNDINSNHKDAKEKLVQKPYPKRLKSLLQTLAPKGVEFRKLGEVLEYDQPNKYCVTSKEFDKSYPTPVLTAGKTFILGYINEKDNIYQASKSSPVIIFDDFTAATQWVDFPFKVKSSAMKILLPKNSTINIRFIFFYMQTIPYNISGEHTRQWISRYSQIQIPIPPLEIQQEIVKILDQFSTLTTDLLAGIPAEIEARKKQYEYYREKLLTFKPLQNKA
ncbi:restriction endonuclease subunit S [Helicobacter pylori]